MALVSDSIPNIINGVSQQAAPIRLPSQGALQVNAYSSLVEGLKHRPPTQLIAKLTETPFGASFVHTINRDQVERYKVVVLNGDLKVYAMSDGTEKTVNFATDAEDYLVSTAPRSDFRAITVADYTFIANSAISTAMDTDTSPNRGVEALVFVKQAVYETTLTVIVDASTVTYTYGATAGISTATAAADLKASLATALGASFTLAVEASVIHIKRVNGADFSVKVKDSRSNTMLTSVKDTAQKFTDLPTIAPDGYTCMVAGDVEIGADDYYVTFTCTNDGETFGPGTWKEGVKGNIPVALDAATMPHSLVREANGTFTFQPVEWGERGVGDVDSAPDPSFVGRAVNDVFFYKNRLGLLADENVILSEAGSFFNFWPTTVTTLLDADRIDVAASHTKVSILQYAVPFTEQLMLFADQSQFVLSGGAILTPKTVSIDQTTEFESDLACKPIGAGTHIYFTVNKGDYTGIREYFISKDNSTKDAIDITAHVPKLIPQGVFKMAAATNEDLILAITAEEPSRIYAYKFYWNGEDKLQSSWSYYDLGDGATILNIDFINTECFLLVDYADGACLERMDFSPGVVDVHTDLVTPEFGGYVTHLDRRITDDECTVTYDGGTNRTTYALPYAIEGTMRVVTRAVDPIVFKPGRVLSQAATTSTSVTVFGDHRDVPVWLGRQYTMRYRFSPPYLREKSPNGGVTPITTGRLQMKTWAINYTSTGFFKVEITPLYRDTSTYRFTGASVGAGMILGDVNLSNGTIKVPVLSRNDRFTLDLVNDSHLPCSFVSAEWEADYTSRSSRL